VPECHGTVAHHPAGVRSARGHCTGHPGDRAEIRWLAVPADLTADTAHVSSLTFASACAAKNPGVLTASAGRRVDDPRPSAGYSRQRRRHHVRRYRIARQGPKMDEHAHVDVMRV